jgi:hypothetical protein
MENEDEEVLVRDDIDATTRFFQAVGQERVDAEEEAASESIGSTTLDFSRFRARRIRERLLGLLDDLIVAIERRDLNAVWDVLDADDAARCFPPAVREEALVIAQMPAVSFRAPMRLYRYYHLLTRLGDEPFDDAQDPAQLVIDLGPSAVPPPSPVQPTPVRELNFPERPSPDDPHDGPHEGPRDGGSHRRRSGSR